LLRNTELVLDALPRAIIVIEADGTIVAWNNVSTEFYGWTADEALGKSLYELVTPPALRDVGRSIVERTLQGERWSGDVKVLLRNGDIVQTFSFLSPLTDAAGEVVGAVCAADDNTELSELSARASALADRLLLALAAGRLGTWQWDAASGGVTWDATMEELFGLAQGEFGGTFEAWVALLHPDDRAEVLATFEQAMSNRTDYDLEHRVRLRDGSIRWLHNRAKILLDDGGVVAGSIGCSSDITDRKLAESAAQRRLDAAEALADQERLQRERLEFLAKLNDVALAAPSPQSLLRAVASTAIPELGDWCSVYFRPESDAPLMNELAHVNPAKVRWAEELRDRFPFDSQAPNGVAAVLRTGTTEYVPFIEQRSLHEMVDDAKHPEAAALHEIVDQLQLTSWITVPMVTRRGVIGAIQFVSAESGRRYTHEDVTLAEAAAGRVGESLVNAWLVDQQRQIAGTLQAALLPPIIPDVPGVTIATRYWAAGWLTEVGGDFYDVFPLAPDRWAVVIGDVCGTGPRAAAVTSIARHTIRAAATHGLAHREVMDWVNEALIKSNKNTFCTINYSTLERLGDGRWRYVTALGGHPRPIHIANEGPDRLLGTHGTLIGMLPTIDITVDSYDLGPGDSVLLYTDGITDLGPPNELSEEQFVELVSDTIDKETNAEEIAVAVGRAIESLVPIKQRHDDVALLIVSIDPRDSSDA